jgi:hypothetical protein
MRTTPTPFALTAFGGRTLAQNFSAEDLARRTVERRAVEAATWGMPLVNFDYMRQAYFRAGAKYNDVIFWSNPNAWWTYIARPSHLQARMRTGS